MAEREFEFPVEGFLCPANGDVKSHCCCRTSGQPSFLKINLLTGIKLD